MRNSILNSKGFSLTELIIVMAILTILLSIASPSIDFIRRERVTSRMREVVADIQKTRSDAITSGPTSTFVPALNTAPVKRGSGIRFASSTSYVMFAFNDIIGGVTSTGNYQYDGVAEEASPRTTTLTSGQIQIQMPADAGLHAPANDVVIFDRSGIPHQTDWQSIGMGNPQVPVIITISDPALAGYTRCITVGATVIQEGFWNAGACSIIQ